MLCCVFFVRLLTSFPFFHVNSNCEGCLSSDCFASSCCSQLRYLLILTEEEQVHSSERRSDMMSEQCQNEHSQQQPPTLRGLKLPPLTRRRSSFAEIFTVAAIVHGMCFNFFTSLLYANFLLSHFTLQIPTRQALNFSVLCCCALTFEETFSCRHSETSFV